MTSATDKAASDKTATVAEKPKPPATANEALAAVNEDHDWTHEPEDLNSTGGLQRAVAQNRDAIQALANFIDKK
jgi:hypothetical protein